MRSLEAALLSLALGMAATPALAGPCLKCDPGTGPFALGWWHDRALSPVGRLAQAPRIDVGDPGVGDPIAVVWEDRTGGDGDIVLATSGNGGCSWNIRALTSGAADDRLPDVAMVSSLGVVAVAFLRNGVPWVTASADGGLTFAPAERLHPTASGDPASPPRIAAVALNGAAHVHAVWGEAGTIRYARSTAGGAPGSWQSTAVPLSAGFTGYTRWSAPDVATDTRSTDASALSAVTLAAAAAGPGRSVSEIFVVRSNDSGATFFGDPLLPATRDLPRRVSDPRPDDPAQSATSPVLDSNDDGNGIVYAWNALGWTDARSGAGACLADARAEEGGTPSVIADWNDPPAAGDAEVRAAPSTAAAMALVPNPLGRPPAPELHAFAEDAAATGAREVFARRGILDRAAMPTVNLFCGPYRLTGLFPPRPAGEVAAGSFAADEDLSHVYVVWADTRGGGSRVYFKRTDTATAAPTAVVAVPVACASGGGLAVSWTQPASPPHCDIDHMRVEYGLAPGIYSWTVDVAGSSTTTLTGLFPSTPYYVRTTAVDEACNEAPAGEVTAVAPDCGATPPCPKPVGNSLLIAATASGDADLTWGAPAVDPTHGPAISYDVYRSTGRADTGYTLRANPSAASWTDAGAALPTGANQHFYRIVARNVCGTSGDEPP